VQQTNLGNLLRRNHSEATQLERVRGCGASGRQVRLGHLGLVWTPARLARVPLHDKHPSLPINLSDHHIQGSTGETRPAASPILWLLHREPSLQPRHGYDYADRYILIPFSYMILMRKVGQVLSGLECWTMTHRLLSCNYTTYLTNLIAPTLIMLVARVIHNVGISYQVIP
jgi:hypothetical protein